MNRKHLVTLVTFLSVAFAGASALACSLPPEGWQLINYEIEGDDDGPFVFGFEQYYGDPLDENFDLSVTVTNAAEDVVAGDLTKIDGLVQKPRFMWTPDAPLPADGAPYVMSFEGPDQLDFLEAQILLKSNLAAPTVTFDALNAEEYAETRTESCCERDLEQCVDSCSPEPEACERCWATSFDYPVLTGADVSIAGNFARVRYDLIVLTGADEASLDEYTAFPIFTPRDMDGIATGRIEEGEPFTLCTAVDLRDSVTGETTRIDTKCINEAEVEPVDRTEPESPDLSECVGSVRFDIDENGERTEAPLKESDGGCSSTGATPGGSLALVLIALFAVRRSRQ